MLGPAAAEAGRAFAVALRRSSFRTLWCGCDVLIVIRLERDRFPLLPPLRWSSSAAAIKRDATSLDPEGCGGAGDGDSSAIRLIEMGRPPPCTLRALCWPKSEGRRWAIARDL